MRFIVVLAAVVMVTGCGRSVKDGELVGAGSTFVYPLAARWIPDYARTHDVKITYGAIGSGGGIAQLTNRTIDLGASDAPMSPREVRACKGCIQIPWALAGTSIAYNVPGAPRHLNLSGPVLAGIFLGHVKSWDDPAIADLNPGAALPHIAVTPIYRVDASGTTYNLTDYLSNVSPEWERRAGTGKSASFPAGAGAKGSAGVSAALTRTRGGITYVELAYSLENGFPYAALRNRAGNFVLPRPGAVSAAAATVRSIPANKPVSIVDPPASATLAYPLSTFTYAIAPRRTDRADVLKPFLRYAIGPGQRFAADLQFAPLPPPVVAADGRTIALITKA